MKFDIHKKNILLFGIVSILLVISYTYARTFWQSTDNTTFDTTIGDVADIKFNNGNNVNVTDLAPVLDYHDGANVDFSIYNRTSGNVNLSIILNITSIATELKSTDFKFVLERLNNSTSLYEVISTGDFSEFNTGNNTIKSSIATSHGYSYFKFYVYIDGSGANNSNLMGKTLNSTLIITDGVTSTD